MTSPRDGSAVTPAEVAVSLATTRVMSTSRSALTGILFYFKIC